MEKSRLANELRGVFGRPGRVVFPKLNFEEAFGRENVHGQTAMPQRDAELELGLALQADFAPPDRDFEYAIEGGFSNAFGIEKAKPSLFHGEFLQVAAHELHYDIYFLSGTDGDAEFAIFKFS
jgi:hypothetical protein